MDFEPHTCLSFTFFPLRVKFLNACWVLLLTQCNHSARSCLSSSWLLIKKKKKYFEGCKLQTRFTESREFQTLTPKDWSWGAPRMCQPMHQAVNGKHKSFLSSCLLVCSEGTKFTGYVSTHFTPCFRRSDIIE